MKAIDCGAIRDSFQAGVIPRGPEVDQHLEGCQSCAELFDNAAELGQALATMNAPLLDEEEWLKLERTLRAEVGVRAWLRSRSTSQRVAVAASCAIAMVAIAALKPRTGLSIARWEVAAWSALFALAAVACLLLSLASLGRRRAATWLELTIAIVALASPVAYATGLFAAVPEKPVASVIRTAMACFIYGSVLALPFVAAARMLDRRERLSASGALFLCGAGGLVGNVALLLHCGINDHRHLLLGHASLGFAFGLVALFSRLRHRT